MESLEGQVALLTGAGDGAGRALALALAARGVRVLVTGGEERALAEVVGEIAYGGGKARHLAGDDGPAAVRRAVELWSGLNIVVAVARTSKAGAAAPEVAATLMANLAGTFLTFDAALGAMKGTGRLLAVSRRPDEGAPMPEMEASHAALVGLARGMASKVRGRGITCNVVGHCAGTEAEQVAEVALFLCGAAARDVSGQEICVR